MRLAHHAILVSCKGRKLNFEKTRLTSSLRPAMLRAVLFLHGPKRVLPSAAPIWRLESSARDSSMWADEQTIERA